jgi:hypothetical protein
MAKKAVVVKEKKEKVVKVKEQISLFDVAESYKGNFVIDFCKLDNTFKDYCKNWDGKGDISILKKDMKCPEDVTEKNANKCKFYVVGTPCRNFRDKK